MLKITVGAICALLATAGAAHAEVIQVRISKQHVHDNPLAQGFDEIIVAGEKEARLEATRRRTGIPYNAKDVASLQKEAADHGLPGLVTHGGPLAD